MSKHSSHFYHTAKEFKLFCKLDVLLIFRIDEHTSISLEKHLKTCNTGISLTLLHLTCHTPKIAFNIESIYVRNISDNVTQWISKFLSQYKLIL